MSSSFKVVPQILLHVKLYIKLISIHIGPLFLQINNNNFTSK